MNKVNQFFTLQERPVDGERDKRKSQQNMSRNNTEKLNNKTFTNRIKLNNSQDMKHDNNEREGALKTFDAKQWLHQQVKIKKEEDHCIE